MCPAAGLSAAMHRSSIRRRYSRLTTARAMGRWWRCPTPLCHTDLPQRSPDLNIRLGARYSKYHIDLCQPRDQNGLSETRPTEERNYGRFMKLFLPFRYHLLARIGIA